MVNDAGMAVPTVLVIEDERAMRRFLWEALHDAGFKVHEAFTLAHAEQQLAREMPALILLDLGLPDGDGMDLLQRLRERSRGPVIVASPSSSPGSGSRSGTRARNGPMTARSCEPVRS